VAAGVYRTQKSGASAKEACDMADKAEKKEAPSADKGHGDKAKEPADKPKGGGLLSKTPVLLGIAMVLEAVVLFAGFKFLGGGPKAAVGAEVATADAADPHAEGHGDAPADPHGDAHADPHGEAHPGAKPDKKKRVEVQVVDFRAPNKQSGRTFLYDVTIFISIKGDAEEKTKAILTERAALIKDRIRTIIAQSDPEKLGGGSEPGLETLRRQIKYQLDEIVGDGIIDEVLVPRCIPFPVNF
jgi:flagellar basal body-associated protein FliL